MLPQNHLSSFFFFNDTATTEIYTLSLHDALPICLLGGAVRRFALIRTSAESGRPFQKRSEEHTSELQSRLHLVCRLLLEKKKNNKQSTSQPLRAASRIYGHIGSKGLHRVYHAVSV